MCTVVSYISSPTYRAKFLDRWFRLHIFKPPHSVKNSISQVANIKDVVPPTNSSLIAFDGVGLFPHIPKAPTIQHTGELLMASHTPMKLFRSSLISSTYVGLPTSVNLMTSFRTFKKK